MELELFTVYITKDGVINVDFNEDLRTIVTEEQLKEGLKDKMDNLILVVNDVVDFLREKNKISKEK